MNKLKIVWICHFANEEIQGKLPLWKKTDEFASWIPNVIKGLELRDDIELHVISPHEYLKHQFSLVSNNVCYHFIPYGIPIIHRHWPTIFRYDIFTDFSFFRGRVKNLIREIHPDLINLIGAENAYYSSSIFDFKGKYPILITIQGFISQMKRALTLTSPLSKRIEIEERILGEFNFFAGEQDSSTYISSFNKNYAFYRLYFPVNESLIFEIEDKEKRYDCIYYGRLSKEKGVEDFIKVIAELKVEIPKVKAIIIGPGNSEFYKSFAKDLGCLENIDFGGFVNTQKELFAIVKSARVFLAPPYFERLSSTIREAMYLKVPIVAYATGGIPYVNEFGENILMVETGNYRAMAEKTMYLLKNEYKRIELAEKASDYAKQEYSLQINTGRLIDAYKKIIIADNL